ncbi:DUF5752 family protein [Synechococcus sp. PCC 7336]|uniref:DUF5752 family protein n=1 Tax=Synechococcus sp. PCC 7336 TaxID=195250 RepID=UPI0003449BC2|nr:DUF5752 family protein [Synechococcus sp. PCC 7336]
MAANDNTDHGNGLETFALKDCALIAIATGYKAETLKEMRDRLQTIVPDSIYFHFWGSLLEPLFEEREYNNDFAAWARRGLHDDKLAERLAMIDPSAYIDMEGLRQELIDIIEERLDEAGTVPWIVATEQFQFIRSQIVVFDTYKRVKHPEEMAELMPHLSVGSIFYHFIDARRRLPEGVDDFRLWLRGLDRKYGNLECQLAEIDPYFEPLIDCRSRLAEIFRACCRSGVAA